MAPNYPYAEYLNSYYGDYVQDTLVWVDEDTISRVIKKYPYHFTREQLDELGIDDYVEEVVEKKPKVKQKGLGLSLLGELFGGSNNAKHSGHCDGNCSKCPDHYGYRYGRWYYGKYHSHGCEFGGNKNSGE